MYDDLYKDKIAFSEYLNSQQQIENGRFFVTEQICSLKTIKNPREIIIAPCDVGQYLVPLKNIYGNINFNLIDKHSEPLKHIKKKYGHYKFHLINCRLEDYNPYTIKGDVIFSLFGLHLIDDLEIVIDKFSQSIGNWGEVFFLTMTPNQAKEHPLGKFFGTRNIFENYEKIVLLLKKYDFQNISETEILYKDYINSKKIEKIFSRYSNSFLFTKTKDELDSFYQELKRQAISSTVSLTFNWTLITGNKGLTND